MQDSCRSDETFTERIASCATTRRAPHAHASLCSGKLSKERFLMLAALSPTIFITASNSLMTRKAAAVIPQIGAEQIMWSRVHLCFTLPDAGGWNQSACE